MQIAGKFIEKSSCEYGVGRKNIFPCLFTWEWAK
jgi:hypothetical protein